MRDCIELDLSETFSENMAPEVCAENLKNRAISDFNEFLARLKSESFPVADEVNITCFRDLYARAIEPLSDRTRQYELKAFLEGRFIQPYLFNGQDNSMAYKDPAHPAYPLYQPGGLDFIFLEMRALIEASATDLLTTEEIAFTCLNRKMRLLTGKEVAAFIWAEIARVCNLRKSA